MSKLQLFRDFVNKRLAAAALEIFGQYEKTIAECQEEICRSKEKIAELQRPQDIAQPIPPCAQPVISLHRTDDQQLSLPEPPQIKEEQELWTTQEGEQLQRLQSNRSDSIFTFPRVKAYCDPEGSFQLPALDKTPTVKIRDSLPTDTTEVQIKVESDEEDYEAPAHSLEEERRGLLPELKPIPSSDTSLRSKSSPSPWTRPIPSSCSGSENEDMTSGESNTVESQYQCEECDKAFIHKFSLVIHRRIHRVEKPYQCDECDKAFRHKHRLVLHKRIHTGEKPYQCEECGDVFSQNSFLVSHRRIHTGERPYQCDECDKAFARKNSLVRHRRIHTGEKPYQCEACGRAFNRKSSFDQHQRLHTGEKPYQCEDCDKAFSSRDNLVSHRRIHTGEKPYRCQDCDKAFRHRTSLINHRIIHKGEK